MVSQKINDNEILISLDITKHYFDFDGRNSDSGYNEEEYRFIVKF